MAIIYNPARVNPKSELIRTAKSRLKELETPENSNISLQACKRDLKEITNYIDTSREYLQRLRSKCNTLIDEKLKDATCLGDIIPWDNLDRSIRPSAFLQKAYTDQTFHSEEIKNINRDQPYINAGIAFVKYCQHPNKPLTAEQQLFDDVGTVVSAINGAISQMNRMKHYINDITDRSSLDDYQQIFMNVEPISNFMRVLTDEVANKKPTILNSNGGIIANAYDDILAMIERFREFYTQYFRARYELVSTEDPEVEMPNQSIKTLK